jgi:hypothetical protein
VLDEEISCHRSSLIVLRHLDSAVACVDTTSFA